jgi:hypothetical protein
MELNRSSPPGWLERGAAPCKDDMLSRVIQTQVLIGKQRRIHRLANNEVEPVTAQSLHLHRHAGSMRFSATCRMSGLVGRSTQFALRSAPISPTPLCCPISRYRCANLASGPIYDQANERPCCFNRKSNTQSRPLQVQYKSRSLKRSSTVWPVFGVCPRLRTFALPLSAIPWPMNRPSPDLYPLDFTLTGSAMYSKAGGWFHGPRFSAPSELR